MMMFRQNHYLRKGDTLSGSCVARIESCRPAQATQLIPIWRQIQGSESARQWCERVHCTLALPSREVSLLAASARTTAANHKLWLSFSSKLRQVHPRCVPRLVTSHNTLVQFTQTLWRYWHQKHNVQCAGTATIISLPSGVIVTTKMVTHIMAIGHNERTSSFQNRNTGQFAYPIYIFFLRWL